MGINDADSVLRGRMCRERGQRGEISGTKAKEENERLRCEINGADCAKGENTMHDRENMKRENKGLREK